MEALEARLVLATFTVTSGFDTGVGLGELRTAIFQANNSPGPDTIVFAPHISTINLILGELDIIDDLTIDGSTTLEGNVTIRAALGNARIFNIDDTDSVIDMSVSMNQLTLTGGNVVGAQSNGGGAIRNVEVLRLQNTVITNNRADYGGGIANYGALYLDRVTLDGNEATQNGGGIFAYGPASLDVQRVTISHNLAGQAGGGVSLRSAGARFQQTTIAMNTASGLGGGMHVDQAAGPLVSVAHSTVTGNLAGVDGGGVHATSGTVHLDQAIVANNATTVPGFPDVVGGPQLIARYSLIGNGSGSMFTEAMPDAHGNLVGGPLGGPLDPELGPLANHGGPTATLLPRLGSPAINSGDPLFSSPPSFDQRGAPYARVSAERIDIGAVEYVANDPDFDGNGILNCADIDALVLMIATGANHPRYDLNGDGQVNIDDLTRWLEWAGSINLGPGLQYRYGDANLDGVVDGSDFGVWNANKFTAQPAWCKGDFNADGYVDGSDFGAWNQNKFTTGLGRMNAPPGDRASEVNGELPPPPVLVSRSSSWQELPGAVGGRTRLEWMSRACDEIFAAEFLAESTASRQRWLHFSGK